MIRRFLLCVRCARRAFVATWRELRDHREFGGQLPPAVKATVHVAIKRREGF